MPLVIVKNKYQVVIPRKVREQVSVSVGDILEAKVEQGKITLTPKTVVDRGIEEGLEDIRAGRVFGPFKSAGELKRSLHTEAKKLRARSRRPAR